MKVYLLMETLPYEDTYVVSVYQNELDASVAMTTLAVVLNEDLFRLGNTYRTKKYQNIRLQIREHEVL